MLRRRHVAVVVLTALLLLAPPLTILSLNLEGQYLLKAKLPFDDPNAVLADWDPRDDTPCNWNGVVCDPSTESVISIDLSSAGLAGPFPELLCSNLRHVAFVSFNDNYINSTLAENDVVSCQSLRHLDLAQNYLTGDLPRNLSELPNLSYLDLTGNNFSGGIPDAYGRFQKLEVLALTENLLGGTIPWFLGNVSTLKQLNLSYNPFSPGRIPEELGNLTNLEVLWLTAAGLVGEIPASLGRLGRLVDLDLAYNFLTGSIPAELTGLTSVVQIELYNNSLTGELPPTGWSNMTNLRRLDASTNQLNGQIPADLCNLPLESLNLYENELVGELPPAIADSPNLYELRLFRNRLNGSLPINLGKSSPLIWLDLSTNQFSGRIPENLCEKGVLEDLLLIENFFSGEIPAVLADCRNLLRVRLGKNQFSGEVPERFWGLPHVSLMELSDNTFSGSIAKNIATASYLSQLILSGNNFSGDLPEEIGLLSGVIELSLADNHFSGPLPNSLTNLDQLTRLDLRRNSFSGELPAGISNWKKMNDLNLADNAFSGHIPDEIGDMIGLNYLDLSGNHFSGQIPSGLQNLKLNLLNLSNNQLSGEILPMYAKKIYRDSFLGNPGLCGDIEGLCNDDKRSIHRIWIFRSMFIIAALLLLTALLWFYSKHRNTKKLIKKSIERSKWTVMSFHKLTFNEDDVLRSLDEDNVIGSGSSGKVYKVVLNESEAVAVKKLWGPRSKIDGGFEAEVETLGRIRHKNVVKLWCCCSARDGKLLVYEYMPNGSLGDVLHGSKGGSLDWPIRFRIALDAAEGLSYLHHDCVPPIVHRDVKSNNILLGADYCARISDFGLAKVVAGGGGDGRGGARDMSVIAGSCGYIAPEYSYTLRVNERSDVYSYGVVILELATGKRPIDDPEFGAGKDLVKWVCGALDQKGVDVVIDPRLDSCFKDEICRVLNVGLLCTSPLPINRPSMRRVVKMLQEIGDGGNSNYYNPLKALNGSKDGILTPYYYEDASDHGNVV